MSHKSMGIFFPTQIGIIPIYIYPTPYYITIPKLNFIPIPIGNIITLVISNENVEMDTETLCVWIAIKKAIRHG